MEQKCLSPIISGNLNFSYNEDDMIIECHTHKYESCDLRLILDNASRMKTDFCAYGMIGMVSWSLKNKKL
jgi:hypothetical protein